MNRHFLITILFLLLAGPLILAQEVCNICGEGYIIGDTNAIVNFPYPNEPRTYACGQLQNIVQDSVVISKSFCVDQLPSYTFNTCKCTPQRNNTTTTATTSTHAGEGADRSQSTRVAVTTGEVISTTNIAGTGASKGSGFPFEGQTEAPTPAPQQGGNGGGTKSKLEFWKSSADGRAAARKSAGILSLGLYTLFWAI